MLDSTYKKILDKMPEGVFVFDDKMRVKFTNASFRRFFSDQAKPKGTLSQTLACEEKGKCGENAACQFCTFFKTMQSAIKDKAERQETLRTTVTRLGRRDKISVRIRVFPVDEKGKLFLGLTDGTFQSEMEQELLSAGQVQRRLLPAGKVMGGIPYSYMFIPCLGVGGDMLDVYELGAQTYGVLADVSGKGLSAGMLSTFIKGGFDKSQKNLAVALGELSEKFNRELNPDERSYITVATVRIDKEEQKLHYAVAGHNAPILLKNSFGINEIESPAPPISNWFEGFQYEERELPYERGDLLVLLTDGVTECINAKGEQFGVERAESVLMQSHNAEDFIGKLKTALGVFSGGKFTDDVTAIAFDL